MKKKLKEEEDAKLDEEIQKRRKRVEMWQAQRRKEADEKAADQDEEGEGVRKWTLEDDDDDEEDTDMKEAGDVRVCCALLLNISFPRMHACFRISLGRSSPRLNMILQVL